jgi:hypothetical protein
MSKEVIIVFTAKTKEQIISEGGTSSWTLDCNRARLANYVICTRNQNLVFEGGKGNEEHQSAFLIGKVKDVISCPTRKDRFLIIFSEYANIDIPKLWKGERNPVKYCNIGDEEIAGIDFKSLDWHIMPVQETKVFSEHNSKDFSSNPLTLAQAKAGLALTFGVPIESVEITIRS